MGHRSSPHPADWHRIRRERRDIPSWHIFNRTVFIEVLHVETEPWILIQPFRKPQTNEEQRRSEPVSMRREGSGQLGLPTKTDLFLVTYRRSVRHFHVLGNFFRHGYELRYEEALGGGYSFAEVRDNINRILLYSQHGGRKAAARIMPKNKNKAGFPLSLS